jgi:tetratricopeptide (TPR) repeat protein
VAREEFARGFRLFWADETPAAAEIFARLVAENPRMLDGWDLLAQSLEKLGRHDEAAAAYEHGLKLTEGSPLWAAAAAKSLYAAGRFAEARQRAELAANGRVAAGWDLLTRIAALTEGPAAAEAVVARSSQTGLEAGELRRRAGLALSEEGHPRAALALLAPLAPSADAEILVALGIALSDAGRQDEAAQTLSRALERDPRSARAEETLGLVELRRERLGEARSHLQRALELDERLAGAWNSLGVVRFRLEGAASACAAWERAVSLDAGQYDALFNLGLVAAESGRTDTARRALRQFVASAPAARYGPDIAKARALLGRLPG